MLAEILYKAIFPSHKEKKKKEKKLYSTFKLCLLMVALFIHRYFSEDSRAICSCLCYSLLGHIYRLCFTIQYYNEVGFLGKLFVNCLVHEASQNCSQIL